MSATRSFELGSPAELATAAETKEARRRQVDAKTTGVTVSVTYQSDVPWPAHDEQFVGATRVCMISTPRMTV
jgi:hypothetical protein